MLFYNIFGHFTQELQREMELELAKQKEELNRIMEEKLMEELEVRFIQMEFACILQN